MNKKRRQEGPARRKHCRTTVRYRHGRPADRRYKRTAQTGLNCLPDAVRQNPTNKQAIRGDICNATTFHYRVRDCRESRSISGYASIKTRVS